MFVLTRRIGLAEASSCEWVIDETAIELRMGLAKASSRSGPWWAWTRIAVAIGGDAASW